MREEGHVETAGQLQGRTMAWGDRQAGHRSGRRFLVGNRTDVRGRYGTGQPPGFRCPNRVGLGTVPGAACGNFRQGRRHERFRDTWARVPRPRRSQVQQNQEVSLPHQPKVVLCKILVENPHRVGQGVLRAITTREPVRRHPIHHHRQTVFGGQAIEYLAPTGTEHVVQRRLSRCLLPCGRRGFFLGSGLPVVSERPRCLAPSH